VALIRSARYTDDPGFADDEPPSTRGGTTGRKPLGVPEDYTTLVGRSWTPSPGRSGRVNLPALRYTAAQRPRYMEGDEWRPASQGPESIANLQTALVVAGYIDATTRIRLGSWDETSREAYADLLSDANAAGMTVEMMLNERAMTMDVGGEDGGPGGFHIDPNTGQPVPNEFVPPHALPLKLPSREDLRAVTRDVIIDRLGEGWSQEEIDKLVDNFIGMAQGRAQEAYQAEVARERQAWETGQPITNVAVDLDIPTAEAFAENEARRRDPGGFEATQVAEDYFPAFIDALGGYT
jgi:hypothetical protein